MSAKTAKPKRKVLPPYRRGKLSQARVARALREAKAQAPRPTADLRRALDYLERVEVQLDRITDNLEYIGRIAGGRYCARLDRLSDRLTGVREGLWNTGAAIWKEINE